MKKNPWKQNLRDKIVRVYPHFNSIPPSDSSSFEPFCWSELLLYKHFRSIPHDIGTTTSKIISHWNHIKGTHVVWHIQRAEEEPSTHLSDDSNSNAITFSLPHTMDEWELVSQMPPGNNIQFDHLEMLGHHEFDKNHNWSNNNIPTHLHETTTSFIELNHLSIQLHEDTPSFPNSPNSLSPTEHIPFDLVISHFRNTTSA